MPESSDNVVNSEADLEVPSEKEPLLSKLKSFNFDEFFNRNKIPLILSLIGLILAGLGVFLYQNTSIFEGDKIEIVNEPAKNKVAASDVIVEIAGSVEKPGVYKFKSGDRIDDLLSACGGISAKADREWVEKYINHEGKLNEGQKVYIRSVDENPQSTNDKQIINTTANNEEGYQTASPVLGVESSISTNINTATLSELDKLP